MFIIHNTSVCVCVCVCSLLILLILFVCIHQYERNNTLLENTTSTQPVILISQTL